MSSTMEFGKLNVLMMKKRRDLDVNTFFTLESKTSESPSHLFHKNISEEEPSMTKALFQPRTLSVIFPHVSRLAAERHLCGVTFYLDSLVHFVNFL